ncbi:hypothetical protein KAT51_02795 [bacterium]|nr:hypothetical protein [bacterium]
MHRKLIFLYFVLVLFALPSWGAEKKGPPLDITSDEVEYSKVKGKEVVVFTGHVVAVQGTTTLKSDQLKLFPDESKAVAYGRAWMKDEKQKMILTGERIEYYHDRRYGRATGKPKLVSEKENFTLTSKKIEAFLPEDRLQATGRVKLVRDGMVATCKVLDYFDKEGKAVLTGNPEIREKENLVTGERITLYVDEYRMVVENKARIKFIPEEKE